MPVEYIAWFRMNVDDLSPREYWATAVEDMGLVTALQEARRRGEERAHTEANAEREARDKARDRKQKERDSIQRLRGQG